MAVSRDIANDKVPETSSQVSSAFSFPEPQQETFLKNLLPPNSQQLDVTMFSPQQAMSTYQGPVCLWSTDCKWILKASSTLPTSSSFSSCVTILNVIYVIGESDYIYRYDKDSQTWKGLDSCHPTGIGKFSLGRINEDLVTIGGQDMGKSGNVIGDVHMYKYNQNQPNWECQPNAMPTPRCWPSVACSDKYIATCGGLLDADDRNPSRIVELLDIETKVWKKVHDLPFQGYRMSSLIDNNKHLFVANSYTRYEEECQSKESYIAMAELKILLGEEKHELAVGIQPPKARPVSSGSNILQDKSECVTRKQQQPNPTQQAIPESAHPVVPRGSVSEQKYWGNCDIETNYPILAKYGGCTIAVSDNKVYTYSKDMHKWECACDLSQYLHDCNGIGATVAVLPDSGYDIMLIGGQKDRKSAHKKVQVISFVKSDND